MSNDQESTRVVVGESAGAAIASAQNIEFMYQGEIVSVDSASDEISFGRDSDRCAFTLDGDVISRQHCIIENANGRIVIKDNSTNGTFLKIGQSPVVRLSKGQSYPLVGRGMLHLGEPFNDSESKVIYFKSVAKSTD